MKLTATCRVCGKPFHTTRKHAQTCSTACRMKASRARRKNGPSDTRASIIGRVLQESIYLLGPVTASEKATRGLTVPRSAALAELNGFLKELAPRRFAQPITDDELKSVLRVNGWRDYKGAVE